MKLILLLISISLLPFAGRAGITGTNLLNIGTYAAGTNTSINYQPPQTHFLSAQTYTLYHSVTNAAWRTTNYLETSFDGGNTWTITATYVTSTNNQTDIWNPNTTALVATNRVRQVNTTNQTLYIQANWIQ